MKPLKDHDTILQFREKKSGAILETSSWNHFYHLEGKIKEEFFVDLDNYGHLGREWDLEDVEILEK